MDLRSAAAAAGVHGWFAVDNHRRAVSVRITVCCALLIRLSSSRQCCGGEIHSPCRASLRGVTLCVYVSVYVCSMLVFAFLPLICCFPSFRLCSPESRGECFVENSYPFLGQDNFLYCPNTALVSRVREQNHKRLSLVVCLSEVERGGES